MAGGDIKIPREVKLQDLREWIISRLNIPGFYQQFITGLAEFKQLSGDGWSNRVLCPLHGDQATPNFFINLITGNFKCMACKSGSVFDFYLLKEGYSTDNSNFIKALVGVAGYAGINIEEYLRQHSKEISSGKMPEELSNARTMVHLKQQEMTKRASTDEIDAREQPIAKSVIEGCVRAMRAEHIKYYVQVRGLSKATIDKHNLGFFDNTTPFQHPETGEWVRGRYSIPVPDREGKYRNIRLYSPVSKPEYKMLNYKVDAGLPTEKGYGTPARLHNIAKLLSPQYTNVVICEGEFKWLLLDQYFEEAGLNTWMATSGTHGAQTFLAEWVEHFRNKKTFFCYDADEAGRINSNKHISEHFLPLISSGKYNVKNVTLPLTGTADDKDIPDYFLKHHHNVDDFVRLCVDSPDIVVGGVEEDEASVEPIKVADLNSLIRDRRYIDQRVTVPLTIVSSAEQTYHAIRTCNVENCPLKESGNCCQTGAGDTNIPYGHPLFIASCMEREESVLVRLKSILCTKDLDFKNLSRIKIAQKKKVVMELYYAHQFVERTRQVDNEEDKSVLETSFQELTHVQVYLLQAEIPVGIEPKGYTATGWVRTNPKTSTAALFIEKMVPIEEDWRKFSMRDPANREIIKYMRDGVKTEEIIRDIVYGVTRIKDADEILFAVLLTFLSPLYFDFNSVRQRGWINTIIIGDSGVGKSKTYTSYSDWIQVGSWFSALTGTRTGLLYAVKKKFEEWYCSAGDYVQASGKILGVDEFQTLTRDVTRSLGNAIDRGVLEVKRAASVSYEARTRLVLLGNAANIKGDQVTLSDFSYGCESLPIILDPMFIRRIDIAIFVAQEPNKEDKYNAYNNPELNMNVTTKITALQMRSLTYWAWTREPRHINFTKEATIECLNRATALSRIYGAVDKVPLINPNDFRENLARLSVACAVLERSIGEDLETLIVLPEHVQMVAAFIDQIYSAPTCGLRQYSEEMARINRMDDIEFEKIKQNVDSFTQEDLSSSQEYYRNTYPTLRLMVYSRNIRQFTLREAMEVTGLQMNWLRRRIDHFKCLNMLQDAERGSFRTTRKFNLFMMKWRQDPQVDAKLESAKNRLYFAPPEEPKPFRREETAPPNGNQKPAMPLNGERAKSKPRNADYLDDPFADLEPFSESEI